MTRIIYIGSLGINILLILMLTFCLVALHEQLVVYGLVTSITSLVYLLIIGRLLRMHKYITSAWLLIILYTLVAVFTFHSQGITAPVGILILGFVVILAGVMLGPTYVIWVTVGTIALLATLQILRLITTIELNKTLIDNSSTFSELIGYAVIFVIFTLIVWLSGISIEKTLVRAAAAERELQRERDSLKNRLEVQMNIVDRVRQKELKQLYKFAELGQLTTIILHELANYLSILTLDIDDIEERHQSSLAIKHAKESIFYIDTIIDQVRNQINNSEDVKKFDALVTLKSSLEQLRKKLDHPNIRLHIDKNTPSSYLIFGDPLRLSQAITILVTNAAQASMHKNSPIHVYIGSVGSEILIYVKDFGTGITKEMRQTLFQPKTSKKGAGLGIGLFVTKQIIETHFKGKIWLDPTTEHTLFNIQIPRAKR